MAFNGSGVFQRIHNWVSDASAGIKIRADRHDQEDDNFAAGLSQTITRDGQSVVTANIPWNGKRLINVGDPVNDQDALTKLWAQNNIVAGAHIADAPPAAAKVGNLWWDSDAGNLYVKFDDGTSTQWVQVNVSTPTAKPPSDGDTYVMKDGVWVKDTGVVKIAGGEVNPAAADLRIPLVTSGFQAVELIVSEVAPSVTASFFVRFSWDGGATFPAAANQYYYLWLTQTGSVPAPAGSGGTTSAAFLTGGITNSGVRGLGKIWWPIPPALSNVTMLSEFASYSGTAYQVQRSWHASASIQGPPNYMFLGPSTGTMTCKWQLNGIR